MAGTSMTCWKGLRAGHVPAGIEVRVQRPDHFGAGRAVLLAGDDPEVFTVLIRQSFADYLADWLFDAADEFRTV